MGPYESAVLLRVLLRGVSGQTAALSTSEALPASEDPVPAPTEASLGSRVALSETVSHTEDSEPSTDLFVEASVEPFLALVGDILPEPSLIDEIYLDPEQGSQLLVVLTVNECTLE
jgi:hypothetical protein